MLTRQEFTSAAREVQGNFMAYFTQMAGFKSYVQTAVLAVLTPAELSDVAISRLNQDVIDKLSHIAYGAWLRSNPSASNLYCAAMAVATIIKEYEWGTQYLTGDGLWDIACRIQKG